MAATITVTGTAGPGIPVTAVTFRDITSFTIDTVKNTIHMIQGSIPLREISISAATTVTATKSGNVWTLVIS